MSTSRFPNLKEIYRQQAEVVKGSHRNSIAYLLVLSILMLILIAPSIYWGDNIFRWPDIALPAGVLLLLIVSVARWGFLKYSVRGFDRAWENKLDQILTDEEVRLCFEAMEEELGQSSIAFTRTVLTERFMVLFDKIGSFLPVNAIEQIDISVVRKDLSRDRFDFSPSGTMHQMSILLKDRLRYVLSDDESEIRSLTYEIRRRHPAVGFTPEAHAYFFPTSVAVHESDD